MPAMVTIEVDPSYSAKTPDDREQLALAKKIGPKEVEFQTAVEAVENSRGLYRIRQEATRPEDTPGASPERRLSDLPNDELIRIMVGLGVKTEKRMKRSDIIRTIEKKTAEIEIVPEDGPEGDAAAEAEATRVAERKAADAGAEPAGKT